MRVVFGILYVGISVGALVALAAYFVLLHRGDSRLLYGTRDARLLSVHHGLFLGLAALGLGVCFYQGALAMLGWLPETIGNVNDGGEFQTLRTLLASLFTMTGLFFVQGVDRATHDRFALRELAEQNEGLRQLLDGSLDPLTLAGGSETFTARIKALEADQNSRLAPVRELTSHVHPEGQLILLNRELLSLAARQSTRLAQLTGRTPTHAAR